MKRQKNSIAFLTLILIITVTPLSVATGKTIYVDDDATGVNDGTSWENAYNYLQDALADAGGSRTHGIGGRGPKSTPTPTSIEIRVAQGTYTPDKGAEQTPGDRMATFQLINGVTLKGGYAGIVANDPNARDIELYESILSGDLNSDDAKVLDSEDLRDEPTRADNSYNVLTGSGTDVTTVLDGFTISDGMADANSGLLSYGGGMFNMSGDPNITYCTFTANSANFFGGGMYNNNSNPTLTNCIFRGNKADGGGGMNNWNSNPTLTNCIFSGNYAYYGTVEMGSFGGGMYNNMSDPNLYNCVFNNNYAIDGGGMYNSESDPNLIDCNFANNSANREGGGMYNYASYPLLTNCTFKNNFAYDPMQLQIFINGGAIYNYGGGLELIHCEFSGNHSNDGGAIGSNGSNLNLANCLFSGNEALNHGGGICNISSNLTLKNCIFSQNTTFNSGSGIYCYKSKLTLTNSTFVHNSLLSRIYIEDVNDFGGKTLCFSDHSNAEIKNCILWDGGNEIFSTLGSTIKITYSNIQDGWEGDSEGNIDADPLFADPNNGDYHLKSEYGRWNPITQTWVVDDVTSPCIDAGDPNTPVGEELFPNGGRINMGAYGGTREASMSQETGGLSLPRVAFIYSHHDETAESFQSLLESYGCPTILVKTNDVTAMSLDSCNLIIVANDTLYENAWTEPNAIAAIEDSGKPIVGLGYGGFDFFGEFGLSIGSPHGARNNRNSISVIDPNYSLFSTPYPIDIPQDGILQLYTETDDVAIYLWPDIPETVVVFAVESGNLGYYPLAMEHNRYFLWGFTESPEKMTDIGKKLFVNVVIWTANEGWENEN